MDSELKKISIVVPIYNVEKYIERCLKSLINQTYKNIEILLIDDGSLDHSLKICNDYLKNDNRISVYHKENGGLSDARNYGLERATGEYICFIDSDDYIEETYIEILYDNLKKYNADISVCGFYNEKDGKKISIEKKDYTIELDKKHALDFMINYKKRFCVCAWNKLYNIKLFNGVKYPYGEIYEDMATTYKLILKSNKIVYTSKCLYNYCFNQTSITNNEKFNEREKVRIKNAEIMLNEIINIYPELKCNFESYAITQYIAVCNIMIREKKYDEKILKSVRKIINENLKNILNSNLSIGKKIQVYCFYFCFKFYRFLICFT